MSLSEVNAESPLEPTLAAGERGLRVARSALRQWKMDAECGNLAMRSESFGSLHIAISEGRPAMTQTQRCRRIGTLVSSAAKLIAVASPALATFQLTQVEQEIGGINGDFTTQIIQLRLGDDIRWLVRLLTGW